MKSFKFLLVSLLAALMVSCGTTNTVPITGRKQHLLVSDAQVLSLSTQQYQEYMKTAKASTDVNNTAMVKRVGQRLSSAVETYLKTNGFASEIQNFKWEFNLVNDKQANAFCMPGGKIVVYEGLLPYTQNEASLAIVLGHEIAHAVAKHSAEQLSKQMRQQYGSEIGSAVLGAAGVSSGTTSILTQVASMGFQFKNLKYSRDNETEADHLGLIFAAMAGYDPQNAIPFWQRMSQGSSSNQSDMFSDHPSDAKRIAMLKQQMPEALKYYKPVTTQTATNSTKTVAKKKATSKKKTTTARKRTSTRRK